jgi:hypothetical protein
LVVNFGHDPSDYVASSDDLECGDLAPLSFVSRFILKLKIRNRKTKESGATSPHFKFRRLRRLVKSR